jgi:hypothetical protein
MFQNVSSDVQAGLRITVLKEALDRERHEEEEAIHIFLSSMQ